MAPQAAKFTRTFQLALSECLKLETSAISAISFAVTGTVRRRLLAGTTTARYTVTMAFSNHDVLQTAVTQISSTGGTLSAVMSQKMGQSITTLALPILLTDTPSPSPTIPPSSSYPSLIPTVEITAIPSASLAASPSSQKGAIIGGVVGGVAILLLLMCGGLCYKRSRRPSENVSTNFSPVSPKEFNTTSI